jgi:hypothetical protein
MSIGCVSSNISSDVRCAVCGQGFMVNAGREFSENRDQLRAAIQQALRRGNGTCSHPVQPFVMEIDLGDGWVDSTPAPAWGF